MYFLSRTEGASHSPTSLHGAVGAVQSPSGQHFFVSHSGRIAFPNVIAWRHRRSAISERAALIQYTRWQASQGDSTLRVPAPGME